MPGRVPTAGARSAGERRLWWRAFGGLLLACATWAVTVPLMTGPDEAANAVRAAAVARGQLTGEAMPELMGGAPEWANVMVEVRVPETFSRAGAFGDCHRGIPRELFFGSMPAERSRGDCPELDPSSREVVTTTYEYRGQPLYYLLVGLPTRLSSARVGLYAMRVVGVLLCSALLASAFASVLRLRAPRLVAAGLLLAVTPEVLYLAGTQNPGGLEIAAALCLWTSGLALVRGPAEPDGRLVARSGTALVVLTLTRGLSPGFAVLTLVVLALVAPPSRRRALVRRRDVRAWLGAAAVALATSAAWLYYVLTMFPLHGFPPTGLADAVDRIPWWGQSMVAVFGSTDVVPPLALHWLWIAGVAVLVAMAVPRAERRPLVLGLGLLAFGVALLISGEGFGLPQIGFGWQGRYVLPAAVGGVVLVAAARREGQPVTGRDDEPADRDDRSLARRDGETAGPGADEARAGGGGWVGRAVPWTGRALVGVFVVGQVWAYLYTVRHYTVGHDGPRHPVRFLLDPDWTPPLPPVVLAGLFGLAVAGLALVTWRATDDAVPGVDARLEPDRPAPLASVVA